MGESGIDCCCHEFAHWRIPVAELGVRMEVVEPCVVCNFFEINHISQALLSFP